MKRDTEKNSLDYLTLFIESAGSILEGKDFTNTAKAIFNTCKKIVGVSLGYVSLQNSQQTENDDIFLDSGGMICSVDPSLPMPVRGLRKKAYHSGEVVFENHFPHSPWTVNLPTGHIVIENVLFAPMIIEGKPVGLLGLANKPGGFSEHDALVAVAFSRLAAITLLNSSTLEALKKAGQELEISVRERTAELEKANQDLQAGISACKCAEEALQRANDQLEKKVGERTAQLLKTNEFLKRQNAELKHVEDELKLKAELLDTATDSIYLIDLEGNFLYFNEATYKKRGYTKEEFASLNLHSVVAPEYAKLIQPRIKELVEKKRLVFESIGLRRDNSAFSYEVHARVIEVRGKKFIISVSRDISGRKQMVERLRESEKCYRRIIETANEGIWIIDSDNRTIYVNDKMADMMGYQKDEMIGKPLYYFVDKDDVPRAKINVERRRQGIIEQFDRKLRRKDGTELWTLLSTNPIYGKDGLYEGALGMFTDITKREQAEPELHRRETQFKTLVENIPDIITRFDRNLKHIYVNPAVRLVTGMPEEMFIGKTNQDLGMPEELSEMWSRSLLKVFATGLKDTIEFNFNTPVGKRFYLSTLIPEPGIGGRVESVLVIARDITKRRKYREQLEEQVEERTKEIFATVQKLQREIADRNKAEKALRESEEMYRSLVETSPDAITVTDINGRIIMANQQAAELHGLINTWEYAQFNAFAFIAPEYRDLAMENALKTLKNGSVRNVEYGMLRKDGTLFPAELSASLIRDAGSLPRAFVGVFRDITERKKAENALRESEEKFRNLFNKANDAIFLISYKDGTLCRFIEVNDVACQNLGYSRDELLEKRPRDLVENIGMAEFEKVAERFFKTGQVTFEVTFVTKYGKRVPCEINSHGFIMNGEQMILSIARDITERKLALAELSEATKKAQRAERLASLGTMAAGIAHEINQPLNNIKIIVGGMLYMHKRGSIFGFNDVIGELKDISAQVDRISAIIRQMRDFVRREAPSELSPCDLNTAVEEALNMLGGQLASSGIYFEKSLSDGLHPILASSSRLEEVFINLMVNAMQSFEGTTITHKKINISSYTQDHTTAVFEIKDNGPGVPEEIRDRIFEPFFTTKEMGEGMGLGLSIVLNIVTSFNGQISVMSNDTGGTIFRVAFPAYTGIFIE